MAVAQDDQELMVLQKQKEVSSYSSKVKALFKRLDENGDGMLSRNEFFKLDTDPSFKAWMNALDINPDDLERLFDLLDTGDGLVSMEEFVSGAARLRGSAKSIDVAQLLVASGRVQHALEEIVRLQ